MNCSTANLVGLALAPTSSGAVVVKSLSLTLVCTEYSSEKDGDDTSYFSKATSTLTIHPFFPDGTCSVPTIDEKFFPLGQHAMRFTFLMPRDALCTMRGLCWTGFVCVLSNTPFSQKPTFRLSTT
jgi:hypothetical protein